MSKIKSYKFFTLTAFFLSFIFLSANAQTNVIINGKVIEARTKIPLQGASISLAGSTNTVTTNNKGEFKFSTYHQLPFSLVISFIGYQTQEIHITNTDLVNVALVESTSQLSDVVIIGYGTQRRSDVTGSVVSVSKSNLNQPVSSPENLLQGAIAGVVVTQSSGQPGASSSVRIRGGNSVLGGNEPLYVVDGFPVYNNNQDASPGLSYGGASLNVLSTINPSDIESIDVLKDASATAIYGTRGANGVVIITTKKGTRGTTDVSYSGYVGSQKIAKKIGLLNGGQWASLQNDIQASLGKPAQFTQTQIDSIGTGSDWESAALRQALTQSHQITVSGGDDKSKFYASGSYLNQDGIVINTNLTRYAANLSYERNISTKFKFGINTIASHSALNGLTGTNVLNSTNGFVNALYESPVVPIKNADGTFNLTNQFTGPVNNGIAPNPIADLTSTINTTLVDRTLGNVYGEFKIVKDLTLKVSFNGDLVDTKQNYYGPSFTSVGVATKGYASVGSEQVTRWLNENTLTYDHVFNKDHYLTVLGGYTTSDSKGQIAIASATNFYTDALTYNSLGSGTAGQPTSLAYEEVLNSFLGRINYSYKHKYNLTASLRADGSSRFPEGHRWGYFPAVGLSWNITEEGFAKNLKNTVNSLKLRFSAGSTGNQTITGFSNAISNYYPSLALLLPDNYSLGNTLTTGLYSTTLPNPNLTWETTAEYNGGVDASFFKNRINVSVDAYYKKTTNLLLNVPTPASTGHASALENLGSIGNKGIEVGINTENIKSKDFTWKTGLTFATNANKVLSLGGSNSFIPAFTNAILQVQVPLILKVGQPVGTFYGYRTNGIVQTGDNTATLPKVTWVGGGATPVPGDRKYVDVSGPNGVPDGKIDANDKVILGNSQPKFTGGFTNTFSYKNFDLLVFLQGSYGGKIFNALKQQLDITTISTNSDEDIASRWTTTNPSNTIPRATSAPTAVVSDRYIEDASYLRIKTLTLGYTLPYSIANKIRAKNLRVYVSTQNLVTWTKYTGFDPEANSFEQNQLNTGVDFGAYPSSKTYLVGLNVTF